jgi:3-oxoacid CoA-transferase B subunit
MGGAMDLVSSNSRVVVTMQHTTKDGSPRILEHCSYPLTGSRVVDRIITEMGSFDCDKTGTGNLKLIQKAPDVSVEDIIRSTGCPIDVDDDLE